MINILSIDTLRGIAPRGNDEIMAELANVFNVQLPKAGIDTYLRVVHFLAQAAHETDGFKTLEEYASGRAYEGRRDLGNVIPGDGVKYKGRGIFQVTGRYNYKLYGNKIGAPLIQSPALLLNPRISTMVATLYWNDKDLNKYADKDDVESITRRINGGLNGIESRRKYLAAAKSVVPNTIYGSPPPPRKKLPRMQDLENTTDDSINTNKVLAKIGDKNEGVKGVQELLIQRGYNLLADGIFGARTEAAIKSFQSKNDIPVTGVIDLVTFEALKTVL